jgi:nitrate reductase delta subunit
MLGTLRKSPDERDALSRIEGWTRRRFALGADAAVMVSEVACGLPGCPPLETVVAFWEGDERHSFKLFKRAVAVAEKDLPPAWLKEALAANPPECC